MFRFAIGYGTGIFLALIMTACLVLGLLVILEALDLATLSGNIGAIEKSLGAALWFFFAMDAMAPGRLVRRCEAYAKNISLNEHEKALGL